MATDSSNQLNIIFTDYEDDPNSLNTIQPRGFGMHDASYIPNAMKNSTLSLYSKSRLRSMPKSYYKSFSTKIIETKKKMKDKSATFCEWIHDAIKYERRANGTKGSILTYNETYATSFGCFLPRYGSIFNKKEMIIFVGGSWLITFLVGYYSCINHSDTNYCIALPDPNPRFLTITTLCAFVIAFFTNMIVQRWWTVRFYVGNVSAVSVEMMMTLASILSTEVARINDPKAKAENQKLAENLLKRMRGLLILSYKLMINIARGEKDFSDLVKRRVIIQKDYQYFTSFNAVPIDVCTLMHKIIQETARQGLFGQSLAVSEANMLNITNRIYGIRSNTSDTLLYITVQLPFPFVQIIATVVYLFLAQLFIVSSAFVGFGFKMNNSGYIMIGVISTGAYTFVLIGILRMFDVLCNPLGLHPADFPADTYIRNAENKLNDIIDSAFTLDKMADIYDNEFHSKLIPNMDITSHEDFDALNASHIEESDKRHMEDINDDIGASNRRFSEAIGVDIRHVSDIQLIPRA